MRARLRHDDAGEVDVRGLGGVLAAPGWLRDLGSTAWLLTGITLLLVALVAVMALMQTIVMPLLAAGIVAAVTSPLIARLRRHHVSRGIGAAILLLAIVAAGAALIVLILASVGSQSSDISAHLEAAANKISGWVQDLGVDQGSAQDAKTDASDSLSAIVPALLGGVANGISDLSSLAFFLCLTTLSLFFLLKDGPAIRGWVERHSGLPGPVARDVSRRSLGALRGYFLGVTAVATFNAVVIGTGALLLGVPLAGTIAVVTFVGAYIPYLGAWAAGAFAVLLALGGAGTDAAVAMIVLELLANGILQQLVQPIAYGAALGIHPLAVLIVTIGAGCLFGAAGLILGAPVASAAVKISADLSRAKRTDPEEPARGPSVQAAC